MNYIKQEMADLTGNGRRKSYYRAKRVRNLSFDEFLDKICWVGRGVTAGQVKMVMDCLCQSLEVYLAEGYSVTIDGLGCFSVSLGAKEGREAGAFETDDKATNTKSIHVRGVNFRASKELVKDIDERADLQCEAQVKVREVSTTEEERCEMAREAISRFGYIRVSDYMALTGLSHTYAAAELVRLACDGSSGIRREGRGVAVVYVARGST